MAAEVFTSSSHHHDPADLHEHPAKKLRTVDGSCRRSNLGVRVTSALQVTSDFARDASDAQACASSVLAEASTSAPQAADPVPQPLEISPGPPSEAHAQASVPMSAPMVFRRPQLEQPDLAGSLDGWLKHNQQLPALKKLRRDSTCSMQSLDAWMDTGGYTSPAPGSPQWFRLQPSPARQAMRASPSIEIQVLSPVFPEQWPEDTEMMSECDPDDDFCLAPGSPTRSSSASPHPTSPRSADGTMDRPMASPATTPRRGRAPSRLGWRSPSRGASAERADDASQQAAAGDTSSTDGDHPHERASDAGPGSHPHATDAGREGGAGAGAGAGGVHDAAELRALELRLLQMLHTGSGMVLVADALRLLRGFMEAEADKDAVRAMLKRWCVLVEHPVGSGCRWLYLRSAAEAAGATIPDA